MKITLYLIKNDPNGLREARIDQWSGRALSIPRRDLEDALKERKELDRPCLYFLITPLADRRGPKVYVGEADGFRDRIKYHGINRDGWQTVVAFYSSDGSLTKTGIQYLESVSITKLRESGWCVLENGNAPRLPTIPPEDKDGLDLFASHITTLMPILGFDIFASPPAEDLEEKAGDVQAQGQEPTTPEMDTLVCPAREEGFARAFLGEHAWWAVRIRQQGQPRIKYLAIYQVAPVSAITYYGEVERIEPFENSGKYKIYLRGQPVQLERPIGIGKNRHIRPQAPRYASIERIKAAKTLDDVFGPSL